MNPLVTVLVPSYNHAAFVAECLESVFHQTYPNIELIVIDDGSKDSSLQILESLCRRKPFLLKTQANRGLTPTLNTGLGLARGKYIAPFASDDVMLPERIEKQVRFLESHPEFTACGSNYVAIDSSGTILAKQNRRPYRELHFEDLFLGRQHGLPAPTALIRVDSMRKIGGYREDIGVEDAYLWLKLTHDIGPLAVLDEVLVHYRQHPGNMHGRLPFIYESLKKTYEEYHTHPSYPDVQKRLILNTLLKASRKNKIFARQLLSEAHPYRWTFKYWKSLLNLYLR